MPLTTLDAIKRKLQLPTTFVDEDAALGAVQNAAEAYILAATRFVLADTALVDMFQQVQVGRPVYTSKRPVTGATAQGRLAGQTDWVSLPLDVLDATAGRLVLPGTAAWPPQLPAPPWAAWRRPMWDVLQVTYTATALSPVPLDLQDAAATLAAYWYTQQRAGPVQIAIVGGVHETYADLPVPPVVQAVLARYQVEHSTWW